MLYYHQINNQYHIFNQTGEIIFTVTTLDEVKEILAHEQQHADNASGYVSDLVLRLSGASAYDLLRFGSMSPEERLEVIFQLSSIKAKFILENMAIASASIQNPERRHLIQDILMHDKNYYFKHARKQAFNRYFRKNKGAQ